MKTVKSQEKWFVMPIGKQTNLSFAEFLQIGESSGQLHLQQTVRTKDGKEEKADLIEVSPHEIQFLKASDVEMYEYDILCQKTPDSPIVVVDSHRHAA